MYTHQQYNDLKSKYGAYSSWAIWDYKIESDTSIIEKNFELLNTNYVLLGLNISAALSSKSWINFHGGKHDRKLKYACNDTELRGSYITDLFKDLPEAKSSNLKDQLTDEIIIENVKIFNQEMEDVQIHGKSQFIILGTQGSQVANMFNKYFAFMYNNPVKYYYHYSFYGLTDQKWVEGFWKILGIKADYSSTINRYK